MPLFAGQNHELIPYRTVMAALRESSTSDLREIKAGRVEKSGEISMLQHTWAKVVQHCDLGRLQSRPGKTDPS